MASERENARDTYLALREQALKADKKAKWAKVWADTHYLLSGGLIIVAALFFFMKWTSLSGGQIALAFVLWIVGIGAWIAFGTVPTKRNLKAQKELHDLKQKMDDLESKYHL